MWNFPGKGTDLVEDAKGGVEGGGMAQGVE